MDFLFRDGDRFAFHFAQMHEYAVAVAGRSGFNHQQVRRGDRQGGEVLRLAPAAGLHRRQHARGQRSPAAPAEPRGERAARVFGRSQVVVEFEFPFLLGAEVGEPVVVHDPGIDVRLGDLGDWHPFAEVEIAQLHQRRLLAADNDLAGGVADGEEALDGLPVGSGAGNLVLARPDAAALGFVKHLAVRRLEWQRDIHRLGRPNRQLADGEAQLDALIGALIPYARR